MWEIQFSYSNDIYAFSLSLAKEWRQTDQDNKQASENSKQAHIYTASKKE